MKRWFIAIVILLAFSMSAFAAPQQVVSYSVTYAATKALQPVVRGETQYFMPAITGNCAITIGKSVRGDICTFFLTSDAVGGHVMTFGNYFTPTGTLTLIASQESVIQFIYDGSTWKEAWRINGNSGLLSLQTGVTGILPIANGGTSTSLDMFMGLYNRERSDKWQIKGRSTASDRYTLQSPAKLAVYLNSKVYTVTAQTNYDLSLEATWDSVATDYRVAATRAGVNFYVYACEQAGNALKILVSADASAPSGYTTTTSRLIGGFHGLCLDVGTISGHALTEFATGDILPESIWDYNHRPVASPAGMVFSEQANLWVDIYLASGTGANTASVFNGTISDNRNWMDFVDDGSSVKKRLLNDSQFQVIASGSNEKTNIFGSADPVTTGAHVDTASRRMISNIGVEDACGVIWQWLLDQSYRYDGGAHTHSQTITYKGSPTGVAVYKDQAETKLNATTSSGVDETVVSSSVDPAPVWAYYALPGNKGSLYRQGTYGDVKLLAGADWHSGSISGSRSRHASYYRWNAYTPVGGRFASEPLNR